MFISWHFKAHRMSTLPQYKNTTMLTKTMAVYCYHSFLTVLCHVGSDIKSRWQHCTMEMMFFLGEFWGMDKIIFNECFLFIFPLFFLKSNDL